MSLTGKQSPLGVNALSGLIQNQGININVPTAGYMGAATAVSNYTYGSIVGTTSLKPLTDAIRQGWLDYSTGKLTSAVYAKLITIGGTTVPALGNSPPSTYTYTGSPSWGGVDYTNEIASWGYIRLFAWQAYNELNYNSTYVSDSGSLIDLIGSFFVASGFITQTNYALYAMRYGNDFLNGTFSNTNDLISADVAGVSLATNIFGLDLINVGRALNTSTLSTFGLPSNLLQILKKYNAITASLSLALLSTGLTQNEIEKLISNVNVPITSQQKAYAAFLIITGVDLADILIPLNCNISGLTTLADLLNIKTLFPNSYQSLTVPIYNVTQVPTNSKTYYQIYIGSGVNTGLTNPAITMNFGSYADTVLPDDIKTAAGAFSTSMLQVKNITATLLEKFAQVVANLENSRGLTLPTTTVPTDKPYLNVGYNDIALGSGPYHTYTFSDFFGCMSGLPYAWKDIQKDITSIQTAKLNTIYQQLFLATCWDPATVKVLYNTNANLPSGPVTYTVTGVIILTPGGGYYRSGATLPNIVISNGGSAQGVIGTDPNDAGPGGIGTYGRITGVTAFSPGPDSLSIPTATIQSPPNAYTSYPYTGGSNVSPGSPGWSSPMSGVVQSLIDDANAEILSIQQHNLQVSTELNKLWAETGTQLTIEQRARNNGILPPDPVPANVPPAVRQLYLNLFPSTFINFIDTLPSWAPETEPHMSAQTLEALAVMSTVAGNSIVGLLRESRNKERLAATGIPLDNSLPIKLSSNEKKQLIGNGVLPYTNPDGTTEITPPAYPANTEPAGYYDPVTQQYITANGPAPTGASIAPGSLAESPYANLISPQLSTLYTSDVLSPASYSVPQAIEQVIICNCDCWVT